MSGSRPAALVAAALLAGATAPAPIPLPGGAGGIGFDDLVYAPELGRLLVPAGRTGALDLVEPGTGAVVAIAGFARSAPASAGHEDGPTSADAGGGYLFAIDRTRRTLVVADPGARRILTQVGLAGGPDYVRWIAATREVWVTEPGREAVEIFALERGPPPALRRVGEVAVPGGPESLVADPARGRAYTNTFRDTTVAIDLRSRALAARWRNRCRGARGLALDGERGLLFVGCAEGKVVSLDVARGGKVNGEAPAGDGVDGIAYGPGLHHLYVPAAEGATLAVLGVGARGELDSLGTLPVPPEAHCAAADVRGDVYVCDPRGGRLLRYHDPYPATR